MTKQIKVSDETYERLQFLSKEAYRTLGGEIDYLIDYFGGFQGDLPGKNNSIAAQPLESSEKVTPPNISREGFPDSAFNHIPRMGSDITREINDIEAEIALANAENQDPDYWIEINKKKLKVQELWAEWHKLTGK